MMEVLNFELSIDPFELRSPGSTKTVNALRTSERTSGDGLVVAVGATA